MEMPSFDDVFGSNVENTEVDYFGISPEDGNGQCGTGSYFGISPEGQNVVEQASQSTKGSKKRSKNFTLKEDNMLVEAWLEVSLMQFKASTNLVLPIGNEFMITSMSTRIFNLIVILVLSLIAGVSLMKVLTDFVDG